MSENKIQLDIVTPQGPVFSGPVDEVTAQGSEGQFGVLPGHASLMTTLKPGLLMSTADGKSNYYFAGHGYAEVGAENVTIIVDSAERSEDIDVERAMEAKRKAEEELRRQDVEHFVTAEAALERAIARLHVADIMKK